VSKPKNRSGDQCNYDCAVVDIVTRLKGMIPVVKNLRDMACYTNCQDQDSTDLDKPSSHASSQSILSKHKAFRVKKVGSHPVGTGSCLLDAP
jgi:hypothetical protein